MEESDFFYFLLCFLFLQACFRRNVTVVTIYASLGEEALCHSLNEVCSLFVSLFQTKRCFLIKWEKIYRI